jgi:hypothetical protein
VEWAQLAHIVAQIAETGLARPGSELERSAISERYHGAIRLQRERVPRKSERPLSRTDQLGREARQI